MHCTLTRIHTQWLQIAVALTLTEVTVSEGALEQFVRISFVNSASQSGIVQPFSGNPGYLKGLPLLVSWRS
jgi:hypothetical protein